MSYYIFIKELDGKIRTVSVDSEEELKNMTVEEFRRKFYSEDQWDLRFIFTGRQLEDDRTLGYYDINDCSTIHTVQRLCGGDPSRSPEDEDEGMPRTKSMDRLAEMQQIEPE